MILNVEASIKEIVNVYRWNELTWATEFSAKFRELWEQDTTNLKEFWIATQYNGHNNPYFMKNVIEKIFNLWKIWTWF